MSENPLNVLKRKLDDESIPQSKRLCLAKNVVQTHFFPALPKERVIAEWLQIMVQENKLSSAEFKGVLSWLNTDDDLTGELKSKLIQILSLYVKSNALQDEDIPAILTFMESNKISVQLAVYTDEYILTANSLLKHLKSNETKTGINLAVRLFNALIQYYKESKKKLEILIKLLDGDNLEIIFDYLDNPECRSSVINVCQTLLFPISKKSFFAMFLQTLIRKENIDELLAEKGDKIQSVVKIMSTFFTFPSGRTVKDHKFLRQFINIFVTCFKGEGQIIFAFYIMVAQSLNIQQSYINPVMIMPPICFEENDEKIKRGLFLNMLEILLENEIDINVRLTETLGSNVSKVEIKKNFTAFLQTAIMGQLKTEGKPDKATLKIITISLKLDPVLIEQRMDKILPQLMVAKKGGTQNIVSYTETLDCLLETLFKLSHGTIFINQILPHIKIILESCNTDQFELQQKIKDCIENGLDCEKVQSKIIYGTDLFPEKCVETFGKLTSDLMFRQNHELLVSLQRDFEEHCLMMLEEGFVSPSIITLAEVLSAILSSFLQRSKMADHTVPLNVAETFWTAFNHFETDTLRRFGECVLKLNYNARLTTSYLRLCLAVSQLRLLNYKYSNFKLDAAPLSAPAHVYDLSLLLPSLSGEQWIELAERNVDREGIAAMNNLIILKALAADLLSSQKPDETSFQTSHAAKSHLIKQISDNCDILESNPCFANVLLKHLDPSQMKQISKTIFKALLSNPEFNFLSNEQVLNNRSLLSGLVLEVLRNLMKTVEGLIEDEIKPAMSKSMNKIGFEIAAFLGDCNAVEYFEKISTGIEIASDEDLLRLVEILKNLQVSYLEENLQLTTIFILLALKKGVDSKKLRKSIDNVLLGIFELSPRHPDLYKLFPIEYIFSFESNNLIDLMTLKLKTTNPSLIVKCLLETAVKKVKTNSAVVKIIVKLLLTNQKVKKEDASNIEYFSDKVFQISCQILPIIAKEKRAITTSAFRSILADLQEQLHKSLLKSFKSINLFNEKSTLLEKSGNPEDSVTISENTLATLNAMEAFSLTLSKYCESTDAEGLKNLDCLWWGLEYFVQNAIKSIKLPETKPQHVDSSIQLLNVVLRNIRKLESHDIFHDKDRLLTDIWQSVKLRLLLVFEGRGKKKRAVSDSCLEDIAVTVKFLCELASVDAFISGFIGDLVNLVALKKPSTLKQEDATPNKILISHQVAKFLWHCCLKANVVGPKCIGMAKTQYRTCKYLALWVWQHYDVGVADDTSASDGNDPRGNDGRPSIVVDDTVCDLLRNAMDIMSGVIQAAKKIPLNYKFLDAIFQLQHMIHFILGFNSSRIRCEIAWQSFFKLYEGSLAVLNSLLHSREELLEDRWPCYLQCYRALISILCERASSQEKLDKLVEDKFAEVSHAVEKLTQSISKRKSHISRLAAYVVGDVCAHLERSAPPRVVRQHLENATAMLIQASDSTYAMSFLRRTLAGAAGQMTMTNMYTMYKRYHKYVGNA